MGGFLVYLRYRLKLGVKEMKDKNLIKKWVYIFTGVILIGVGIAWMRFAALGTDPFSSMVIGLTNVVNVSFWHMQMFMLAVLLIVVVVFNRSYLGWGTLIHLVLIGFVSDNLLLVIERMNLPFDLITQLGYLAVGILILCLGAALYMNATLGIASYDALALIMEEQSHGKLKFKWARIITDVTCVLIGFVLGATTGIGTFIMAFLTGPIVGCFRKIFAIK